MSAEQVISGVKTRILKLLCDLDHIELDAINEWICNQTYRKDLQSMQNLNKNEALLKKLSKALKKIVPLEAVLSSETIEPPKVGDQSDCNKVNTCHVDAFLYNDDETEELVKQGRLKRYYCVDCGSRNTKDLIFISHSISRTSLQYIFKVLLPEDLQGKQILDIGSRLGTVLYAAYHLTNASQIIGIEFNKECCDIQESIIDKFSLDKSRVKNIYADVMDCQDIVSNSDIVILNTIEFFVDTAKHKEIWYFLKKCFKKGSYLIFNGSVSDSLSSLDMYEEMVDWLTVCKPCQMENEILFDMDDLMESDLSFYTVH